MAHIKVALGQTVDVSFRLYTASGGALTDPDGWVSTDGSTWPTAKFYQSSGGEITSSAVRDITGDTLDPSFIKHPDGTTGIFRKSEGYYAVRVQGDSTVLSAGTYDWTVTYRVNNALYTETHTIEFTDPGDVVFGEQVLSSVTAAEVKRGIVTTLDDATLLDLVVEGAEWAEGYLLDYDIDPDKFPQVPKLVKLGVIYYTRYLVMERDISAISHMKVLKEGDKRVEWSRPREPSEKFYERAEKYLAQYCARNSTRGKPKLGVIQRTRWQDSLEGLR